MAAIQRVTTGQPRTYVPAVGSPVSGGQCVEARAGGRIGPAAAGSLKFLGVALTDATAPESFTGEPTLVGGQYVLNAMAPAQNVALARVGDEVPVVFSAAAAFGDKLVCTANGQVAPAGATPDARTIVGKCVSPAGVVTPGTPGLMQILA